MAVGLAFVDILGDTSGTEAQVERDMSRVLATVQDALSPVEIQAAVDAGTEQDLTRELNSDIRAAQQAINAIRVNTELSPEARRRLTAELRGTVTAARAAIGEIQLRVAERPIVEETVAAVETAVQVAEAVAPPIEIETRIDNDRVSRLSSSLSGLGGIASSVLPVVGRLGTGLAGFASAVPAVAGLSSALVAMAPAAALAAPAIASIGLAVGTVKIATIGVGDAVKQAFDPSDPEKYAEALKGLAPNARGFVEQLHAMQPALQTFQQGVQNQFFAGFGKELAALSKSVLPQFEAAVGSTAGTLNKMALGAAGALRGLSEDGALGTALKSATAAFGEFQNVPGKVVIAFGQLAAAAGPIFSDLAVQASGSISSLLDRLSGAFASGGLQNAIQGAVALIGDLFGVLKNVGSIIGSVFGAAQASGAGFVGVLGTVTSALAQAFANPAVTQGLQQLFATMGLLSATAGPILVALFVEIAKVVNALMPSLQVLITALGEALTPIVTALGPVLMAAAQIIGTVVTAIAPLLVVAGQLVALLGPILTPILNALNMVFVQLAPVIKTVGDVILAVLAPILGVLPVLLQPILDAFTQLTQMLLPLVQQLLIELQPSLVELSTAFVSIATALAPVIAQLLDLSVKLLQKLMPAIIPIIGFVGQLAAIFADELAKIIETIVVPAIELVSNILKGDFSAAFQNLKDLVKGVISGIIDYFVRLPASILEALGGLAESLFNVGSDILDSLIKGIKSKFESLKRELTEITNLIPSWKGPASRDRTLLTASGQLIMGGLIDSIHGQRGALRDELGGVTDLINDHTAGTLGFGAPVRQLGSAAAPPAGTTGVPTVQVFVGDRELTDIVDVRLAQSQRPQVRAFLAGARG